MDIRQLQRAIVKGLEDVKAQNIVVLDTEHLSPFFERVIVASGTSNRQTKALAASVRDTVKTDGWPIPRMEGQENGEWIIVDCGPAVVHVMQPLIRDYYRLEEIWGDRPIALHDVGEVQPTAPASKKTTRVASKTLAVKKASAQSFSSEDSSLTEEVSQAAAAPRKTPARKARVASASRAQSPVEEAATPPRPTRQRAASSIAKPRASKKKISE